MMPNEVPEEEDLSQYEVKPVESSAEMPSSTSMTQEPEEDLSQYEVKPEGGFEKFLRKSDQIALSVLENAIGAQGLLRNLLITGLEKSGQAIYGATIGGEWTKLKEGAEQARNESVTPQTLRDLEKKYFDAYYEPRNENEKLVREISDDVGAFLAPIPGAGAMTPIRAIGTAIGGQAAKQVAKQFTDNETTQDVTKLGGNFLVDLISRRISGNTASRYIDDLYNTERVVVPQGTMTTASRLEHEVNNVLHDVQLSNIRPASAALVERTAQQVASDIQNGQIGVHQLLLQKRRLNEIRGDPALHTHERPLLNRLSRAVENEIEHYGQSINADNRFLPAHVAANEAHGAMAQSRAVTNFIARRLPHTGSHLLLTLFGEVATGHAAAIPATLGAAAGLGGVVKTGELLYRVMASPTLRQYYLDVLSNAARENAVGVSKAIHKLDKGMKKEGLEDEFSDSSESGSEDMPR